MNKIITTKKDARAIKKFVSLAALGEPLLVLLLKNGLIVDIAAAIKSRACFFAIMLRGH